MVVARHDHSGLGCRQRQQVVVARVDGTNGRWFGRVGLERSRPSKPGDDRFRIFHRDSPAKLRVAKGTLELSQEQGRYDQLELTLLPRAEYLRG